MTNRPPQRRPTGNGRQGDPTSQCCPQGSAELPRDQEAGAASPSHRPARGAHAGRNPHAPVRRCDRRETSRAVARAAPRGARRTGCRSPLPSAERSRRSDNFGPRSGVGCAGPSSRPRGWPCRGFWSMGGPSRLRGQDAVPSGRASAGRARALRPPRLGSRVEGRPRFTRGGARGGPNLISSNNASRTRAGLGP